jgi:LPPG:FO 2-phospho-L-lactate transferase
LALEALILAGGTGGAKLARGMRDVLGAEALCVIANTADDIEIYGSYVSPDPDLISFWLADLIDERGWGLQADTFRVMEALRELGADVFFELGDRDLAWCLERARLLAEGHSLTAALATLNEAIGQRTAVLPMSDDPVRSWIRCGEAWHPFQRFMIRRPAEAIADLQFRGISEAAVTERVLSAIDSAEVIVIGPSNPLISIGPILAVEGLRQALIKARAPIVAVSPLVGGRVLKGPTDQFMRFAGLRMSAEGVAEHYGPLLDGMVADEQVDSLPSLCIDTLMLDASSRARVAEQVLTFGHSLRG